jgi:hypothetical protein
MKKLLLTIMVLSVVAGSFTYGQVTPKDKGLQAITMDAIKGQLEFLASDWTEGRATGTKGYYLACDYVASMFKVFGTAGAGDPGGFGGRGGFMPASRNQAGSAPRQAPAKTYFQDFTLIENLPGGVSSFTIKKNGREFTFEEGVDYRLGRGSMNTKFEAPVVYVGYGLVDKANGIDDFAGVDVKGKIIVRLSGFPGSGDINSPMYKKLIGDNQRAVFEMSRKKNETLAALGVAGVIDITATTGSDLGKRWGVSKFDNNMSTAETDRIALPSLRMDTKEVSANAVNLTVTEKIINLLIKDSGIDIPKYEKDAAAGIVKFKPVILAGTSASFVASVKSRRINVRNVVAMIEGENPNEFVALGAHLDHYGMENGKVWNGADDNASGVVAVMTLAKAFAASGVKPKRTIVFCAWVGEEEGLFGSEYFTMYPVIGKIADYKFYMNFDMIARDVAADTAKNMAGITYTKAFPKLEEVTKNYMNEYKINLNLNIRSADAPSGGSDYTAFSNNKIPVIAWMAAMHPDYHQPSDQVNLVNWNKMLNIIKLGYLQMWEAANGEIK